MTATLRGPTQVAALRHAPWFRALFLTDIVFSNPNGREGALVLLRDADHLFDIRLENIRDLDYHFVTPIVLTDGQSLNLSLACTGANASPCDPTVFYSGYTRP